MEARDIPTPAWMTPAFFTMIAIGALLALAIIIWGTLRRRAKASERRRAEAHRPPEPLARPAEAVVPAPPPVAEVQPAAEPIPPPAEETLTAPPPLPAAEGRPLTLLKGLGPKAAARLGQLGVASVEGLAAKSDAELAALDAALGALAGRIARDRWAEQARLLAAGDIAGFEARFGKLGG
ncbi:MAG: hypothetical protein K2X73_01990 [Sphingomonas sp.]|uniref:hypothetical protein n=1 Tax=Sphingomonas sp. TaxID=28214 RepID=UPI0025DA0F3F|nr:hypothetical protein [Sphingomonas sp.]MBX9880723.1 hypothetical protein [Sphingomonas sp.]